MLPSCYFDTPIGQDLARHQANPSGHEILHQWHNEWKLFPDGTVLEVRREPLKLESAYEISA